MLLGIITNNVPEIIADTLAALEIPTSLFHVIVGIDEREMLKPEPYLFTRALASAAVSAGRAVMAGDSPFFDLAPAPASGCRPIRSSRRQHCVPGCTRERGSRPLPP